VKKLFCLGYFIFKVGCQTYFSQFNYNEFVNPFIGTGGHGHTFPGAVLPFGMVQLSPDTRIDGSWDGCSGYHYSDSLIYGFSHTHLSGTGVSDWGDILLMPGTPVAALDQKTYASKFSHKTEKASPGFYQVLLLKDEIQAELTATLRAGIHRYTFPKNKKQSLVLDLLHRDKTLGCDLNIIDSVTVSGYRISEAWAKHQVIYFVIKFSKPFKKTAFATKKERKFHPLKSKIDTAVGAIFEFDSKGEKPLIVKVAISSLDEAGAMKNLTEEAPHWDFEKYKKDAENTWNKELQKVEIKSDDKNKLSIFYTALYHCFIHPSVNMDIDGRYRGRDDKIHVAEGFVNYSVFSLWDTYRALNPLFTILQPKRTRDFIQTFLVQYKQSGRLPVWELSSNETDCMIGFHSVSVIADAFTKGIRGFDTSLAFEAMKAASNYTAYSIPTFNKNGYLQLDDESESVSKTLEYAYDNWCIGRVAEIMGKTDEAALFYRRAQAFKNLYDNSTGFMRPRKNGNWLSPFFASEINNHFTEGNSWQYSFYVPHDITSLIQMHGGDEQFERKLDELFSTSEKTKGREQADVTGLVGQYAQGNEPSHHMAWLYNYVGQPTKTIMRVNQISNDFYKNTPDGLIGNEDCGQMSAWYVFSALGMYPVCPGDGNYVLGAPQFDAVKLNLESGKTFSISYTAKPWQILSGVSLNGKVSLASRIRHEDITNGGALNYLFTNSDNGSEHYGQGIHATRSLANNYSNIIPAPIINSATQIFKDQMTIGITPINGSGLEITYTTDDSEPSRFSKKFALPFVIDSNCTIKARAFSKTDSSVVTRAFFYKVKNDYDIKLNAQPHAQYAADGQQTLLDGMNGDTDWRKGNWLGFQGQDFECVVDLKKQMYLHVLGISALQDMRAWIMFPTEVSFYGSTDNKNYELLQKLKNKIQPTEQIAQTFNFETPLKNKKQIRFIKIKAKNFGTLPDWHLGAGGQAYIFVDEITVK
jgi:predicted alpha-1,2-mannosidase